MSESMTSLQRVLTSLSFQEPDRVPFFLLLTMHGAKELHLSIKEYFSSVSHVVKGQLLLREKYGHDCLTNFFYAAIEVEALGAEILFRDDGPANCGKPILTASDIATFSFPEIADSKCLQKVLETTASLKKAAGDEVPVVGVAISPFSVPIMQMGFEEYLNLIYDDRKTFDILMRKNEEFCVAWANAQLEAGATAICYFDPMASSTIIPPELYRETGFLTAQRTIKRINGPTATHLASGRTIPVVDMIRKTGTNIIGFSCDENPSDVKKLTQNEMAILGNLNGVAMGNWTATEAEEIVKETIKAGAPGGGFILSDTHGEIPFNVPDEVLFAISEAVKKWGAYPLRWIN